MTLHLRKVEHMELHKSVHSRRIKQSSPLASYIGQDIWNQNFELYPH